MVQQTPQADRDAVVHARKKQDAEFNEAFIPFDPSVGRMESDIDPRDRAKRMVKMQKQFYAASMSSGDDLGDGSQGPMSQGDVASTNGGGGGHQNEWETGSHDYLIDGNMHESPGTGMLTTGGSRRKKRKPRPERWAPEIAASKQKLISLRERYDRLKARTAELERDCALAESRYKEKVEGAEQTLEKTHETTQSEDLVQRQTQVASQLSVATKHGKLLETVAERCRNVNKQILARTKAIKSNIAETHDKMADMYFLTKDIEEKSWDAEEHLERLRSTLVSEHEKRASALLERQELYAELQEMNETLRDTTGQEVRPETVSTKATEEDDGEEAIKEMSKTFLMRAPLSAQLEWDRQQEHRVAAGMERLEALTGANGWEELLDKYDEALDRRDAMTETQRELAERVAKRTDQLGQLRQALAAIRFGPGDGDGADKTALVPWAGPGQDVDLTDLSQSRPNVDARMSKLKRTLEKSQGVVGNFQAWMVSFLAMLDLGHAVPATDGTDPIEWSKLALEAVEQRCTTLMSEVEKAGLSTETAIGVRPSTGSQSVTGDHHGPRPNSSPHRFDARRGIVVEALPVATKPVVGQGAEESDSDDDQSLADAHDPTHDTEQGTPSAPGGSTEHHAGLWHADGSRVLPDAHPRSAAAEQERLRAERKRLKILAKKNKKANMTGTSANDDDDSSVKIRKKKARVPASVEALRKVPTAPAPDVLRSCECCVHGETFGIEGSSSHAHHVV